VLDQVYSALDGLDVREFGGIEPNPSYETLMNAVKIAREENITFLLAVGGGPFWMARSSSRRQRTTLTASTVAHSGNPAATLKAQSRWAPC
jgi:alcohol dehydrogenase YqhD (iron-dependent ADH family)